MTSTQNVSITSNMPRPHIAHSECIGCHPHSHGRSCACAAAVRLATSTEAIRATILPAMHHLFLSPCILLWRLLERRLAPLRAEVIRLPTVGRRRSRAALVHVHAAHRVLRHGFALHDC